MLKKPMSLFNQLCTPAKIYLVLSIISVTSMFYQNYSDPKKYCVGTVSYTHLTLPTKA